MSCQPLAELNRTSRLLVFYLLYPNILNIIDDDRRKFHPVVKFPHVWSEGSSGILKIIPNYQASLGFANNVGSR